MACSQFNGAHLKSSSLSVRPCNPPSAAAIPKPCRGIGSFAMPSLLDCHISSGSAASVRPPSPALAALDAAFRSLWSARLLTGMGSPLGGALPGGAPSSERWPSSGRVRPEAGDSTRASSVPTCWHSEMGSTAISDWGADTWGGSSGWTLSWSLRSPPSPRNAVGDASEVPLASLLAAGVEVLRCALP